MKCTVCTAEDASAAVLVTMKTGKGEALCDTCLAQLRQTMKTVKNALRRTNR